MKTKIYNLLSVLFISMIFNSCFYAKTTSEDSASNDTLSLNENYFNKSRNKKAIEEIHDNGRIIKVKYCNGILC